MPRYRTTIETGRSPAEAFDYMASFENVASWDPGVVEAHPIGDGGPGPGRRYAVTVSAGGRRVPLEYRITEFDPPRRVVLVAETATLRSVDQISVEAAPAGAKVHYDARVDLLGLLRPLNPLFGLAFKRTGDRAAAGLARALAS